MATAVRAQGVEAGVSGAMPLTGAPLTSGVQEFSQVVDGSTGGGSKLPLYLAGALFLAVAGWYAYDYMINGTNPLASVQPVIDDVVAKIKSLIGGEEESISPPPVALQPATPIVQATREETPPPLEVPIVEGNPYWALPNKNLDKSALGRMWTPDEEESLRAGLSHRWAYQRWRTIQEVRRRRLSGSDVILWDGMQDPKFWTRMGAAIGLAELNVEVSLTTLEGLLANARPELVADYFERYTAHPNSAQAYVLRQVIRLLDERGRLVALTGINRRADEFRDLYLVAASRDPGPAIKRWITPVLARRHLSQARLDELLAVVEGRKATAPGLPITGTPFEDIPPAAAAAVNPTANQTIPQPAALPASTPQDPPMALAPVQTDGDVEFYDPQNSGATTEEPDPRTFEYSE